jgi:hypothetical protein
VVILDEKVKYIVDFELSENVKEALNSAVQAIYFNDRSDYLTALWEVVNHLLEGMSPDGGEEGFISELVNHLNPNWNN